MMKAATIAERKLSRFQRITHAMKRRLEAACGTRELGETSDHPLPDRGISRGDVDTIAYKRYGRS